LRRSGEAHARFTRVTSCGRSRGGLFEIAITVLVEELARVIGVGVAPEYFMLQQMH